MNNVIVTARNPIGMVDDIQYLGDGLFRVDYTRESAVFILWPSTPMTSIYGLISLLGVMVDPTYTSAPHSTHKLDIVAVTGAKQYFDVVLRDRFEYQKKHRCWYVRLGPQMYAIILTRQMSQQLQ